MHEPVHTRLMRAYWEEGQNIGDEEVLLGLVGEAGLDADEAAAALAERRYSDRVDASTYAAQKQGINGIPAFVVGERFLILGAQPHETFERALAQIEAISEP